MRYFKKNSTQLTVTLILILMLTNLHLSNNGEKPNFESCYTALTTILNRYTRPITILEITTSQEDYSFSIAHQYNAACIMIKEDDSNKSQTLAKCAENKELNNLMLLKKKIMIEDLERLASCEHFDIVLIFNLHNRWQKECERTINAVLNLGDNIIIGIPPTCCGNQLKNYLIQQKSNIIWRSYSHSDEEEKLLFWFKNQKKSLDRHHWLGKPGFSSDYIITSNFHEKNIYKKREQITNDWLPGINLLTFIMLNGQWPHKNRIKSCIEQMHGIEHEDLMIWNMIIQGTEVIPIDYHIASKNPFDPDLCISFALNMVEQSTPELALQWFKGNWPLFAAHQNLDIPVSFFDVNTL